MKKKAQCPHKKFYQLIGLDEYACAKCSKVFKEEEMSYEAIIVPNPIAKEKAKTFPYRIKEHTSYDFKKQKAIKFYTVEKEITRLNREFRRIFFIFPGERLVEEKCYITLT